MRGWSYGGCSADCNDITGPTYKGMLPAREKPSSNTTSYPRRPRSYPGTFEQALEALLVEQDQAGGACEPSRNVVDCHSGVDASPTPASQPCPGPNAARKVSMHTQPPHSTLTSQLTWGCSPHPLGTFESSASKSSTSIKTCPPIVLSSLSSSSFFGLVRSCQTKLVI